jgi:hypothetical protein
MTDEQTTPARVRIFVTSEMADDQRFIESMAARADVELVWPVGPWVWEYEERLMREVGTRS